MQQGMRVGLASTHAILSLRIIPLEVTRTTTIMKNNPNDWKRASWKALGLVQNELVTNPKQKGLQATVVPIVRVPTSEGPRNSAGSSILR